MSFVKGIKPVGWVIIVGVLAIGLYFGLKSTGVLNKIIPPKKTGETLVPDLGDNTQGQAGIRLAHWTWNAHQAFALANGGKTTEPDSINAKNGINVQFFKMEDTTTQLAALVKFAKEFDNGHDNSTEGIHFYTIMGDAGGMALNDANKALKGVNSDFDAEIIDVGGFSFGEDKFMGPPEWKSNPKSALGGTVAGVAADGDWNVMIFWAAQNSIPFNSDPQYYDPKALNFVNTDDFVKAGEIYNANKPVERVFKDDGRDCNGKSVKKGDRGFVCINGLVTWTPVDKSVAEGRGGVISIASTREYANQMPLYIIGIKQWDQKHKGEVIKFLAGIHQAADLIIKSDMNIKRGAITPKSDADYRWKAAVCAQKMFGSETPEFWYRSFDGFKIQDSKGLQVEIGGSSVANLQRSAKYFGLDGGESVGQMVYNRFAKLAKTYYPDKVDKIYPWNEVFNPDYIRELMQKDPELASTEANLPVFNSNSSGGDQVGELTYRLNFDSGRASFQSGAEAVLREALEQLAIANNTRVEIHGHTDSMGDAGSNMQLSKLRSEAVYSWLKSHSGASFPSNRVRVVPHGQTDLVANDYQDGQFIEENAAKNRRVVIKIFKK